MLLIDEKECPIDWKIILMVLLYVITQCSIDYEVIFTNVIFLEIFSFLISNEYIKKEYDKDKLSNKFRIFSLLHLYFDALWSIDIRYISLLSIEIWDQFYSVSKQTLTSFIFWIYQAYVCMSWKGILNDLLT